VVGPTGISCVGKCNMFVMWWHLIGCAIVGGIPFVPGFGVLGILATYRGTVD